MVYDIKPSLEWKDWLSYDPTSPSGLRWKVEIRRGSNYTVICASPGDIAGYLDSSNYWIVGVGGLTYKGHRICWELENEPLLQGEFIDHINRDGSDNNLSNLRVVDRPTNQRNRGKNACNTSGFTGVSFHHGSGSCAWRAKWHDMKWKRIEKYFSIKRYGNDEAFRLACEYRAKMIASLNEQGAGYTERHGT